LRRAGGFGAPGVGTGFDAGSTTGSRSAAAVEVDFSGAVSRTIFLAISLLLKTEYLTCTDAAEEPLVAQIFRLGSMRS
jgi:hypothetical protein